VEGLLIAVIGLISAVSVALIEKGRRTDVRRWEENKADHNFVVDKIENLGKSLGISIDRVEKGVERTEKKVDEHIRDHAKGEV
jgi:ribonuclease PH